MGVVTGISGYRELRTRVCALTRRCIISFFRSLIRVWRVRRCAFCTCWSRFAFIARFVGIGCRFGMAGSRGAASAAVSARFR